MERLETTLRQTEAGRQRLQNTKDRLDRWSYERTKGAVEDDDDQKVMKVPEETTRHKIDEHGDAQGEAENKGKNDDAQGVPTIQRKIRTEL